MLYSEDCTPPIDEIANEAQKTRFKSMVWVSTRDKFQYYDPDLYGLLDCLKVTHSFCVNTD